MLNFKDQASYAQRRLEPIGSYERKATPRARSVLTVERPTRRTKVVLFVDAGTAVAVRIVSSSLCLPIGTAPNAHRARLSGSTGADLRDGHEVKAGSFVIEIAQ